MALTTRAGKGSCLTTAEMDANIDEISNRTTTTDMNNNDINYVNQLHFNDNLRFYDEGNDNYLNFKWGDGGSGGIKFYDGNGTRHATIYGDGTGESGLLDDDGHWFLRSRTGSSNNYIYCNNNAEFYIYTSYTYSPGSSRAPIFYDSNNTGYYLNPASTSNIKDLTVTGTLTETSDIKLKSNIEKIPNALDKVSKISGYTYNKKGQEGRTSGIIAQEVEKVLPEVVSGNKTKSVAYANMVGLLVESIKELKDIVEEQSSEINVLKEKLKAVL